MSADRYPCDACGGPRKVGDVCCVYVPIERPGWCAWCGETLADEAAERAFCGPPCSVSYAEDVAELLAGGPRFSAAILWTQGAFCRAPAETFGGMVS